jgi:hypothetical protein
MARTEDPAGGVSCPPQRDKPWLVCRFLPLWCPFLFLDTAGAGAGASATVPRGTEAGTGFAVDLRSRGAATALAGARFGAADLGTGAGAAGRGFFEGGGGTAASCSGARGGAAFSTGGGMRAGVVAGGGGGGPDIAII